MLLPQNVAITLQETLSRQLRDAILAGTHAPGSRLPASRALAQTLGVSRVTVEAAYARLEAEGYVRRRVGAGTFVAVAPLAPRQGRPSGDAAIAGLSRRGSATVPDGILPTMPWGRGLHAAVPDLRLFPRVLWQRLQSEVLLKGPDSLFDYGDSRGYLPLRQAIAGYLAQSRGVRCDADQVLVMTSSQQAIQLLASLLLDPGDVTWLEDPGYPGARAALQAAGASLVGVPVDDEGLTWREQALPTPRLIYTTPSHQYPLGMRMSLARRLALLDYARAQRAWVIEDDYDGEYQYDHAPLPAMQGLDDAGCVLYVGTFSKVLFPGLRLAYAVVPKPLVPALAAARRAFDGYSSQIAQAVTARFIEAGYFAQHLRHTRLIYRSRRDVLLEALHPLRDELVPQGFDSGLRGVVRLPPGKEAPWTAAGKLAGLQLRGLAGLYLGQPGREGWMLAHATLDHAEIHEAVAQLSRVVHGR
ncbi:MocR-like pyridoxine biosynthesis transcription factor PdxR [Chitinolyticbacter albus]|uniref:MocR-like pyridoxine biosynthesis transcription factor PdxR n=1 Tax=Chitinolyticbacter albus TaxID=2961951 RepID=UPI00210886AC|nr:PLP-dependent aminotransferase family protein [Chitinolyticbacter albus]